MADAEIEAMSAVADALNDLEDTARDRVLQWAYARYGSAAATNHNAVVGSLNHAEGNDRVGGTASTERQSYGHFAELFAAAAPKGNEDKALVAAYWLQIHEGEDQWQSRRLNVELKHLGHSISNITDALTTAMRKKPQRVIQLKKSGAAKQATKTYTLTNEGIAHVDGLIGRGR